MCSGAFVIKKRFPDRSDSVLLLFFVKTTSVVFLSEGVLQYSVCVKYLQACAYVCMNVCTYVSTYICSIHACVCQ